MERVHKTEWHPDGPGWSGEQHPPLLLWNVVILRMLIMAASKSLLLSLRVFFCLLVALKQICSCSHGPSAWTLRPFFFFIIIVIILIPVCLSPLFTLLFMWSHLFKKFWSSAIQGRVDICMISSSTPPYHTAGFSSLISWCLLCYAICQQTFQGWMKVCDLPSSN